MPFPLIPLLFGGASALGGLFGGKDKQQSQTQFSNAGTQMGTVGDNFSQATTQGFAPGYAGISGDLINRLFGTFGGGNLDVSQLKRSELADKNQANQLAQQLFNSIRGSNASRGLAYSPSSEGLARGLSEGFRGSSLLDATRNYAQQLFQAPLLQEQLDSSRRGGLLNLFNALPRTQTSTGDSTRTTDLRTTQSGTQSGTSTGKSGNPIINAISGGLGGFGLAGGFNGIPNLANLFRTPPFNPDANSYQFT